MRSSKRQKNKAKTLPARRSGHRRSFSFKSPGLPRLSSLQSLFPAQSQHASPTVPRAANGLSTRVWGMSSHVLTSITTVVGGSLVSLARSTSTRMQTEAPVQIQQALRKAQQQLSHYTPESLLGALQASPAFSSLSHAHSHPPRFGTVSSFASSLVFRASPVTLQSPQPPQGGDEPIIIMAPPPPPKPSGDAPIIMGGGDAPIIMGEPPKRMVDTGDAPIIMGGSDAPIILGDAPIIMGEPPKRVSDTGVAPIILGGSDAPIIMGGGDAPIIMGGGGDAPIIMGEPPKRMTDAGDTPIIMGGSDAPIIMGGSDAPIIMGGGDAPIIMGEPPKRATDTGDAPIIMGGDAPIIMGGDAPIMMGGDAPIIMGGDAPYSSQHINVPIDDDPWASIPLKQDSDSEIEGHVRELDDPDSDRDARVGKITAYLSTKDALHNKHPQYQLLKHTMEQRKAAALADHQPLSLRKVKKDLPKQREEVFRKRSDPQYHHEREGEQQQKLYKQLDVITEFYKDLFHKEVADPALKTVERVDEQAARVVTALKQQQQHAQGTPREKTRHALSWLLRGVGGKHKATSSSSSNSSSQRGRSHAEAKKQHPQPQQPHDEEQSPSDTSKLDILRHTGSHPTDESLDGSHNLGKRKLKRRLQKASRGLGAALGIPSIFAMLLLLFIGVVYRDNINPPSLEALSPSVDNPINPDPFSRNAYIPNALYLQFRSLNTVVTVAAIAADYYIGYNRFKLQEALQEEREFFMNGGITPANRHLRRTYQHGVSPPGMPPDSTTPSSSDDDLGENNVPPQRGNAMVKYYTDASDLPSPEDLRQEYEQILEDRRTSGRRMNFQEIMYKSEARLRYEDGIHDRCARRLLQLASYSGGVYIKAAQHIASLGHGIPTVYPKVLSLMQDRAPPLPFDVVHQYMKDEFQIDHVSQAFSKFDEQPIAAASLAQVHKAVTHDGQPVAVKIQYPFLDHVMPSDISTFAFCIDVLARLFPRLNLKWLADEFSYNLVREINFTLEAQNTERISALLGCSPHGDVYIPQVRWDLSTQKIMTTEFINGCSIGHRRAVVAQGLSPTDVATTYVATLSRMLFSLGFVHADPHPGNALIRPRPLRPDEDFRRWLYAPMALCLLPVKLTIASCSAVVSLVSGLWDAVKSQYNRYYHTSPDWRRVDTIAAAALPLLEDAVSTVASKVRLGPTVVMETQPPTTTTTTTTHVEHLPHTRIVATPLQDPEVTASLTNTRDAALTAAAADDDEYDPHATLSVLQKENAGIRDQTHELRRATGYFDALAHYLAYPLLEHHAESPLSWVLSHVPSPTETTLPAIPHQVVVLDHGLYREFAPHYTHHMGRLWESLFRRDDDALRFHAQQIGLGKYWMLLPLIFAHRLPGAATEYDENGKFTKATLDRFKQSVQGLDMMEMASELPNDFAFTLKTLSLLRHVCNILHYPRDLRLKTMFCAAVDGVHASHLLPLEHDDDPLGRVAVIMPMEQRRMQSLGMLPEWVGKASPSSSVPSSSSSPSHPVAADDSTRSMTPTSVESSIRTIPLQSPQEPQPQPQEEVIHTDTIHTETPMDSQRQPAHTAVGASIDNALKGLQRSFLLLDNIRARYHATTMGDSTLFLGHPTEEQRAWYARIGIQHSSRPTRKAYDPITRTHYEDHLYTMDEPYKQRQAIRRLHGEDNDRMYEYGVVNPWTLMRLTYAPYPRAQKHRRHHGDDDDDNAFAHILSNPHSQRLTGRTPDIFPRVNVEDPVSDATLQFYAPKLSLDRHALETPIVKLDLRPFPPTPPLNSLAASVQKTMLTIAFDIFEMIYKENKSQF